MWSAFRQRDPVIQLRRTVGSLPKQRARRFAPAESALPSIALEYCDFVDDFVSAPEFPRTSPVRAPGRGEPVPPIDACRRAIDCLTTPVRHRERCSALRASPRRTVDTTLLAASIAYRIAATIRAKQRCRKVRGERCATGRIRTYGWSAPIFGVTSWRLYALRATCRASNAWPATPAGPIIYSMAARPNTVVLASSFNGTWSAVFSIAGGDYWRRASAAGLGRHALFTTNFGGDPGLNFPAAAALASRARCSFFPHSTFAWR